MSSNLLSVLQCLFYLRWNSNTDFSVFFFFFALMANAFIDLYLFIYLDPDVHIV